MTTTQSWTGPEGRPRPGLGGLIYMGAAVTLSFYFAFAAVQGEYGVMRQVQISNDLTQLKAERDGLRTDLARLKNLTHRLSDNYLDLDLLGQQVRSVLGYMRPDEIAIR